MLRRKIGAELALGCVVLSGFILFLRPDVDVVASACADPRHLVNPPEARPDLTVILKASKPSAPGQDVSFSTTVKNIGAGSAPPSSCDVIIRNARPPRQELRRYQESVPALDPGDTFTFTITVKPGFGAYEGCAVADAKNLIIESDETNNRSCEVVVGK
jgi:subtilase family serine protease